MPEGWRKALPDQESVTVLPVAIEPAFERSGWCVTGGELDGPEIEVMCGGINTKKPDYAGVWRQGNLLHFGFQSQPSKLNENGRKLLLNGIDYIARFATDRPIVRVRTIFDAEGPAAPMLRLDQCLTPDCDVASLAALFSAPWREQIERLDPAAAYAFVRDRIPALVRDDKLFAFSQLAFDAAINLQSTEAPRKLTALLDAERGGEARELLHRLLPTGPEPDTTANNWRNWLGARQRYLVHDPRSLVFRLDPVAQWRRAESSGLRGPARADGDAEVDAEARELAAKVVAFHGGARALDDLRTFSCRLEDVHYLWDRANGILRIENHGEVPVRTRTTPWQVIVFDAAADRDLIMGGGPAPRPRISGRGMYRQLVERIFLPLLLLERSTSLQLLPEGGDGNHRLQVRIAGSGLDPHKTHVLIVEPNGKLVGYDYGPSAASRSNVMSINATTQVGPLQLPTTFANGGRVAREHVYRGAEWNPRLPDRIIDAVELLLEPPK